MRTDDSDNNCLEAYGTDGLEECIVRRASRVDTYVLTYSFKWNDDSSPGVLVRWLSPGDYLAIAIPASDDKPRLYKRAADGPLTTVSTSGTAVSLTDGNWYEAKVAPKLGFTRLIFTAASFNLIGSDCWHGSALRCRP